MYPKFHIWLHINDGGGCGGLTCNVNYLFRLSYDHPSPWLFYGTHHLSEKNNIGQRLPSDQLPPNRLDDCVWMICLTSATYGVTSLKRSWDYAVLIIYTSKNIGYDNHKKVRKNVLGMFSFFRSHQHEKMPCLSHSAYYTRGIKLIKYKLYQHGCQIV